MKKRYSHIIKAVLAFAMVFVISTNVYADSLEDAQSDKKEAEDNKSQAEQILEELEAEKDDLAAYISALDVQLNELQEKIDDLNTQKSNLEADISAKQAELEAAKQEEAAQYAAMCARIQFMYENDTVNYMDALLTATSMSDVLNEPEYVEAVANYDYDLLTQLVETKNTIAADEAALEEDLAEVEALAAEVEEEEATVRELVAVKEAQMEVYQAQIDEQERLIAQFDAEIQAAAAEIAAIEAAAAATPPSDDYVPYSGGVLTWPVPSSSKINSEFGRREPDGGVVTANHYGVDIGCENGTPVVAAASGVVVLARYSSTAGNWIIISHGNGLYTIYMHASALYVSAGQYVNAGDTIMLSGATGATQGRHLHFEVRVGGYTSSSYSVNPMNYFN